MSRSLRPAPEQIRPENQAYERRDMDGRSGPTRSARSAALSAVAATSPGVVQLKCSLPTALDPPQVGDSAAIETHGVNTVRTVTDVADLDPPAKEGLHGGRQKGRLPGTDRARRVGSCGRRTLLRATSG